MTAPVSSRHDTTGPLATAGNAVASVIQGLPKRIKESDFTTVAGSIVTAIAVGASLWYLQRRMARKSEGLTASPDTSSSSPRHPKSLALEPVEIDAKKSDPALLGENSEIKSFRTSRYTYPGVRVFYRPSSEADQLPKDPAPLPLLVFVHGLGGSVAQFHPLLQSFTKISSCLAVDLPGCGVSDFAPKSWDAYKFDALVELLETVISDYRDKKNGQGVVLIGHSLGCAMSARLASKVSPRTTDLAEHVVGLVAICPPSGAPTGSKLTMLRCLLCVPGVIFDAWRTWDRRGGLESASVKRFVGPKASLDSKRLQLRYNGQSKTPVWRRMAWDALAKNGIASKETWATLDIPIFLIAGEDDHVTPLTEMNKIRDFLQSGEDAVGSTSSNSQQAIVDVAAPVDTTFAAFKPDQAEAIDNIRDEDFDQAKKTTSHNESQEDPSTPQEQHSTDIPPQPAHPPKVVKTIVLPRAGHGMHYMSIDSHVVACKIADFLADSITGRLSQSWQLRYLSGLSSKWDVKNLAKWKGVASVSEPIACTFLAMKTMREVDEDHSPAKFVEKWGTFVKDVVDISKDSPVYDPAGLERANIKYHKFPTVSKIPPTDDEVDSFIELIDRLRTEQKVRAKEEDWAKDEHYIGVHCHYGFNRTGYFIACYLVERCGYETQQAIDLFAKARPNGIRHAHFRDKLHVRYSDKAV